MIFAAGWLKTALSSVSTIVISVIPHIYGSRDLLAANPENTAILADSLPTAELMVVDGAGHMFFNREIWNILFDRIRDFIMKK